MTFQLRTGRRVKGLLPRHLEEEESIGKPGVSENCLTFQWGNKSFRMFIKKTEQKEDFSVPQSLLFQFYGFSKFNM